MPNDSLINEFNGQSSYHSANINENEIYKDQLYDSKINDSK